MKYYNLFIYSFLMIFSLCSLQVKAQSGGDDVPFPESMILPMDSLLSDWRVRTFIISNEDCSTADENPFFEDSIYIDRLSRIPTVMEMPYNDVVRRFIDQYNTRLRKNVSVMLATANFYIPIFEEALDAYDLPIELKYLPIIESALNPSAVSRAGASGLWQFMIGTGKIYGLESNSLVDERRDPLKSTWAAARYLKELYDIYKDWNLVIAAYNCGPGNVNKAIRRSGGQTDYWAIYEYLPRETRGYVPAFIAANYVMTYYCDHNICPLETDFPADTDTVQVSKRLHFEQIADLCNVSIEQLKSLNPQYKRNIIPGDVKPYTLRLPHGQLCAFIDKEDSIYSHRASELFTNRRQVEAKRNTGTASKTAVRSSATTAKSNKVVYHKIRSGETLSTIARKYKVTVNNLKRWNNLRNNNIRAGKQLKIYR
ncbi:MAG: transglycosylase SLT domain-containing protein [Bacteroides sp.]|nr:transglycosylase SLT domain-containing protein [Bacteroides sp.]